MTAPCMVTMSLELLPIFGLASALGQIHPEVGVLPQEVPCTVQIDPAVVRGKVRVPLVAQMGAGGPLVAGCVHWVACRGDSEADPGARVFLR